jgi:hypothetical protein
MMCNIFYAFAQRTLLATRIGDIAGMVLIIRWENGKDEMQ